MATAEHVSAIQNYQEKIKEKHTSAVAGELSLRTDLENLLNSLRPRAVKIMQETQKQDYENGNPDFRVYRQIDSEESLSYNTLIGYIETKKLNENLDKILKSEQIRKYLEVSPNIILTDYNRFMLLAFDKVIKDMTLFPYGVDNNLFSDENEVTEELADTFIGMLEHFFDSTGRKIRSKKELVRVLSTQAFYLAVRTREYVLDELNRNRKFTKYFMKTFESFKEAVSYEFDVKEFCDIFGQSVVYGLFVSYIEEGIGLDENEDLVRHLPNEFSLLVEFLYFAYFFKSAPQDVVYAIQNIKRTIVLIDKERVAADLRTDSNGLTIYLYEDFLKAYDNLKGSEKRKEGGVYYTPEPVVKFIVRSIDDILKKDFRIEKGFAADAVKTLDFATGTGSFLAEVFNVIIEQERSPVFQASTIKDKFLKDIYGFELMFVPYIVAHIKLSKILRNAGFSDFSDENRLQVYLTNTLDLEHRKLQMSMPLIMLEEEYEKADEIKSREEVLVILGNPPYNVKSKNKGNRILRLLDAYKQGLNEKKTNLDDDYIKFIRFAQWKLLEQGKTTLIDECKSGVMGFITNNSFIWGRTHRKMREHLYCSFDQIYILNLHGGKDDPTADKNVFDIQTGVCISLFVKHKDYEGKKAVYYYSTADNDVLSRNDKFSMLNSREIPWKQLEISAPYYWFIDKELEHDEYERFLGLDRIFELFGSGNKSERDGFIICKTDDQLDNTLSDLKNLSTEAIREKYDLPTDSRDWSIERAQKDIKSNEGIKTSLVYRPFDVRKTFFTGKSRGFWGTPSSKISPHFLGNSNIGLLFRAQIPDQMNHALVTTSIVSDGILGTDNKGREKVAPLYLYHKDLDGHVQREANFTAAFKELLPHTPFADAGPEEILAYIYAVLYSPVYRERYQEYLKIDYPKIPLPGYLELFEALSLKGAELIALHTMSVIPNSDIMLDFTEGADKSLPSFVIEKMPAKQRFKDGILYLNADLCIKGIPNQVWKYMIGGYQVMDKWIKYRVGHECSRDELEHLQNIASVLWRTIEIQEEIGPLSEQLW